MRGANRFARGVPIKIRARADLRPISNFPLPRLLAAASLLRRGVNYNVADRERERELTAAVNPMLMEAAASDTLERWTRMDIFVGSARAFSFPRCTAETRARARAERNNIPGVKAEAQRFRGAKTL